MAKVAILYESLGRSKGGIEAWIFSASEELIHQGHEVTIFYVNESDLSDAAPVGVHFVKLKPHTRLYVLDFYSQIWSLYVQLKSKLSLFDMVWARSFTMARASAAVIGENRVVYVNAAPYSFYGQISLEERLKKSTHFGDYVRAISSELSIRIAYRLERRAIQNCKNVFLSNTRKSETLDFFGLRSNHVSCAVIPAGVNINRFFPRSDNNVNETKLKIISVCRLAPDKNVQCILRAIKELCDENVISTLTIVGEGEYERELKQLVSELKIQDSVLFVGRQENVEWWYRQNDVFVLPSLYEGFGSVYVEAMASGLPCIAISNKSGKYSVAADEIIEDGVNGLLMLEDNSSELRNILAKLQSDRVSLKEMGIRARATVEKWFLWKNTIDALLAIK